MNQNGPFNFITKPLARLRASLRPHIRTFPEKPKPESVMYKICERLDMKMVCHEHPRSIRSVYWLDATFRPPLEGVDAVNARCLDISKSRVASLFEQCFGYPLSIDPLTHAGPCVQKSDDNAKHDGAIVQCPISELVEGCVYCRLIESGADEGFTEVIRTPIVGNAIPLVYLKRRPAAYLFMNHKHAPGNTTELRPPDKLFTSDEMRKLIQFCELIGLDFGELDVLRDRTNGLIYVVDANTTPFGPPGGLPADQYEFALTELSRTFKEIILNRPRRK